MRFIYAQRPEAFNKENLGFNPESQVAFKSIPLLKVVVIYMKFV